MASTTNPQDEHPKSIEELPFLRQLKEASRFKPRSSKTHDERHAPELLQHEQSKSDKSAKTIDLVLLGDSMFERLLTTGHATKLGKDNAALPEVFNAGVGGDRIVNVIYRLIDKGLLWSLRRCGVRYIMIEMGTNDLSGDKNPVSDRDVELYGFVVQALRWACPGVSICVCGLNPRSRVKRQGIVEESNRKLKGMVDEIRESKGWLDVDFMRSDPKIIDFLEDDGVHLNEEGYAIFGAALWERYQGMKATAVTADADRT